MNVPEHVKALKTEILQKSKDGVKSITRVLDIQMVYLKDRAGVAVEFSDNDAGFGFSADQEKKLKEIKKKKERNGRRLQKKLKSLHERFTNLRRRGREITSTLTPINLPRTIITKQVYLRPIEARRPSPHF